MKMAGRRSGWRGRALLALVGMMCISSGGACDLGEFTTTSTVTLDGREVVEYLVESAVLTPINTFVHDRLDEILDQVDDDKK